MILRHFRQHGDIENKAGAGLFDPVTKADREAEELIRGQLKKDISRPRDRWRRVLGLWGRTGTIAGIWTPSTARVHSLPDSPFGAR